MASPADKHSSGLPVLEPIKIRSTENAEDESSESEPEDEEVFEVTNDSDSEPEADREMNRAGSENESDGMKVLSMYALFSLTFCYLCVIALSIVLSSFLSMLSFKGHLTLFCACAAI